MGIIPELEMQLLEPLVGSSMLELGNKRNKHGTYKEHFEALGIAHTSVDINGKDGALALDLNEPLGLPRFDIVTNFGTSEHVRDQTPCWRNIIGHAGRLIVSTTPLPGNWKKHGRWYPKHLFYEDLARLNGFRVEKRYNAGLPGKLLVCVRLVRIDEVEFTMPDPHLIFDNGYWGVGLAA